MAEPRAPDQDKRRASVEEALPAGRTEDRWRPRLVAAALVLVIALGAFLRLYGLGYSGVGNAYYAATVQSMLGSWRDFFFGSFEPGGSVTVDKPPLGFWVQAASAAVLGVNGTALALPQALAGVLSIPLLYGMVRRPFGPAAGLAAALALAVTPVAVSTERNNTVDGLLVLVLLLAAWAVLRSVERGRVGWLVLGAALVGLGFNIKMLQAYMPLPALYALYVLGARHTWWKRLLHLALATAVLLVVSLSWAVAVDLTPAEGRPYVGSSSNDSVLELVLGHNGLARLGLGRPATAAAPPPGTAQPGQGPTAEPAEVRPGGAAGPGNAQEVGQPGVLRLLSAPLAGEAGWLLPLALLGLPVVLAVLGWRWPPGEKHLAVVLWAGWLAPEVLYFSFSRGIFHAYYLIMLGPPLAALVGAVVWALGRVRQRRPGLGLALAALLGGGTIAFQLGVMRGYEAYALATAGAAVPLLAGGLGLLAVTPPGQGWVGRVGLAPVVLAVLVAPLLWSSLTTFGGSPDGWLPRSGPQSSAVGRRPATAEPDRAVLEHVLAHSAPGSYLLVTGNANQAAPYVLATGRPVLPLGGFSGGDNIVSVEEFARRVASGELRFVLDQGLGRQKPAIAAWVRSHCRAVPLGLPAAGAGGMGTAFTLYDCAR